MQWLYFTSIVLIYQFVDICNSQFTQCPNVLFNYFTALKLFGQRDSNDFWRHGDDSHSDLPIPLSESDLLVNRITRSQVLLETSTLLMKDTQTNQNCKSKSFRERLIAASRCIPKYLTPACVPTKNSQYRPVDGKLNDRCKNTGKSFEPYGRVDEPHYSDCLWAVRKSKSDNELPKARQLVNGIFRDYHRQLTPNMNIPNFLAAMFAQYIAHDIGSRVDVKSRNASTQCCTAGNEQPIAADRRPVACCPLEIPKNDPDYTQFPNVRCLNVIRSDIMASDLNEMSPAQQLNEVTAFLDNSNLYGYENAVGDSLRGSRDGQMITNDANILPERNNTYYLGDPRLVSTPQLAVIHSIYLREHNRIASILTEMNPHWSNDRTFEETRRIVIAQYQHITYQEFLPAFIDPSITRYLDDPVLGKQLDAVTFNEFNGGVFRVFHSFLPSKIHFISDSGAYETHTLNDLINNGSLTVANYDDIIRGLLMQPLNADGYDPDLFQAIFDGSANVPGKDFLTVDIIRGRDHGLPPYVDILELLNGAPITNFWQLSPYISEENIQRLRQNYESVEDVDLLTGAILENPLNGTLLGPTTQLLMMQQFLRLKDADPYFYTNPRSPKPFTPRQLREIRKATTNLLFCLNSKIRMVPEQPSISPATSSRIVNCDSLSHISYREWRERSF